MSEQTPVPVDVQSLPGWLRAAVFLGVPSVIALFLVYVLTTQMADRMQRVEQVQALQTQTLAKLAEAQVARQSDANAQQRHFDLVIADLIRLVRQTCVVAANTADERAACFRGGKE